MRHPLDRSWLIPGTVEARREPNLVEKNEAEIQPVLPRKKLA
jgi:hypothetical protein